MNFFFHYNKPESKKAKEPRLSLHFDKKCHIIHGIKCNVPVISKNNKKQPYCVIKGKAKSISFDKDVDEKIIAVVS